MKNILFISSDCTGCGHKSISESLKKQIALRSSGTRVTVIDGFTWGNWVIRTAGRLYNPLAVKLPALWGCIYRFGNHLKEIINRFVSFSIHRSFLRTVHELQPDLIVTVHALFVGSVLNILEKEHLKIPVVTFVADLDNVSGLWADARAKYILCPTAEAGRSMLQAGIKKDKVFVTGFPVREDFCDVNPTLPAPVRRDGAQTGLSVLLISGSQGSAQVLKITKMLLRTKDIRVTIIAGNNSLLKNFLEKSLAPYLGNRVTVYGFVKNMKKRMSEADLLIIRASPNVLMEAVNLCKPVIVVGALKGQEEKNPDFVLKNKLGMYCRDIRKLPEMIHALQENSGERLRQLCYSEYAFRNPKAAGDITDLLLRQQPDAVSCTEPASAVPS